MSISFHSLRDFLDRRLALKESVRRAAFRARLLCSVSPAVKARYLAYDHRLFHAALRENCNKNGRELHSIMHLQHVLKALDTLGCEPGGEILEIGAGRAGLPVLLLLIGFDKVHINEITNVENRFDRRFLESIQYLASLTGRCRRRLDDVVIPLDRNHVKIRPEFVVTHSHTDAAELPIEPGGLTAAVSFTVLEHLRDPRAVFAHLHELLCRDGWMCHVVDMRDHEDFQRPLDFLKVAPESYRPVRGDWCNRMRDSDFVRMFGDLGFDIVSRGVTSFNQCDARRSTDFWEMLAEGLQRVYQPGLRAEEVWVNEAIRRSLNVDYRGYDLSDLSTLQAEYLLRKRSPA